MLVCMYLYTIASRNIADWWLAYWISHTHKPLQFDDNSSVALLPQDNFIGLQDTTNYTTLIAASDNLAFYLGIYGGLATANSVRHHLTQTHTTRTVSILCVMV